MDKDVIAFYESRNLPIEDLILKGKARGVRKGFVEQALIQTVKDFQDGKVKKPISIAWAVWALAKRLSGKEYAKRIRHELKEKAELIQTIETLEVNLKKEKERNDNLEIILIQMGLWFPVILAGIAVYLWNNGYIRW